MTDAAAEEDSDDDDGVEDDQLGQTVLPLPATTDDGMMEAVPSLLPPPPRVRRQRISTRKYEFLPLDPLLCAKFRLDAPIGEIAERLGSDEMFERLVTGGEVTKPSIPITKDFAMTVHNVVLTTELFERLAPEPSSSSLPPPTELERYDAMGDGGGGDGMNNDDDDMLGAWFNAVDMVPSLPPLPSAAAEEEEDDAVADEDHLNSVRILHQFQPASFGGSGRALDQLMFEADRGLDVLDPKNKKRKRSKAAAAAAAAIRAAQEEALATGRRYYEINLRKLNYYMRHYGTQLNTKRFTAVVLRNDDLSAASLIFSSKMVSTGCAPIELAIALMKNALDKIRSTGFDGFEDPTPSLCNIVSNGRFPRPICINMMAVLYGDCCVKVPQFPGVMVFLPRPIKRVTLFFPSGEVCNSGAKVIEEIYHDLCLFYPMMLRCIKTRKTAPVEEKCAQLLTQDMKKSTTQTRLEALREELKKTRPTAIEKRPAGLKRKRATPVEGEDKPAPKRMKKPAS